MNNKSANAEPEMFWQLLKDLLQSKNLQTGLVTSDNSTSLNHLFANKFPEICHYLNLWHIFHNMYRKFVTKFNKIIIASKLYIFFVLLFMFFYHLFNLIYYLYFLKSIEI